MNCRTAQKWISAAMDGELSPRRRARLDRHLETCAGCRAAREAWGGYGVRLKAGVPPAPPAEQAWLDIRRAIRTSRPEPEPAGVPWARLRWAVAAAVVLLAAVSVPLFRRAGPAEQAGGAAPRTEVEMVETSLPGAMMMVYEDEESGMTMIWVVEANGEERGHAGS